MNLSLVIQTCDQETIDMAQALEISTARLRTQASQQPILLEQVLADAQKELARRWKDYPQLLADEIITLEEATQSIVAQEILIDQLKSAAPTQFRFNP